MTATEIRDARLAKGMTQEQLAEKVGVRVTIISRWENGKNKPMKVYEEKLRKALK